MDRKKIVTIGGATQDIYLHYHGADCMRITQSGGDKNYMLFKSGAKIEVEKILYYTGGGATNSAVSFKRQGFFVACFCMVGDDSAGKAVFADLEQERIDTSHMVISKEHTSGTSYVVNSLRRDRTIFAFRGANGFLQEKDIPFNVIKAADQLYITSLSNESAKLLGTIVSFAKQYKIAVAINPGVSQLSSGALELKKSLPCINVLILNSSEAKTFMGALVASDQRYKKVFECTKLPSKKEEHAPASLLHMPLLHEDLYFSLPNFFKAVMAMGPTIVVVTDGKNGVYVAHKDSILFHPGLDVDVVDTLGAGDSFGSCFVGLLAQGMGIEDALRGGVVNSASVVGHMGAKPGLLTDGELKKRIKNVEACLLQRYKLK